MSLPSSAGALRPQCRKKNGVTKMKAGTVLFIGASFPLTVFLSSKSWSVRFLSS